jgi:DNA polymerase III subunit delta'
MTSFIISSTDRNLVRKEAFRMCTKLKISKFDMTVIKRDEVTKKSDTKVNTSIGIEDIKKMQERMFLKPIQSPAKAIIIPDSQLLTIPAQNALLKILEEPPRNTYLFLLVDLVTNLLPTIISRCQIISLESTIQAPTEEQQEQIDEVLSALEHVTITTALSTAERLAKQKDEMIYIVEQVILALRNRMLHKDEKDKLHYARIISRLQETTAVLKTTNANPRLQLETLFLSFV